MASAQPARRPSILWHFLCGPPCGRAPRPPPLHPRRAPPRTRLRIGARGGVSRRRRSFRPCRDCRRGSPCGQAEPRPIRRQTSGAAIPVDPARGEVRKALHVRPPDRSVPLTSTTTPDGARLLLPPKPAALPFARPECRGARRGAGDSLPCERAPPHPRRACAGQRASTIARRCRLPPWHQGGRFGHGTAGSPHGRRSAQQPRH